MPPHEYLWWLVLAVCLGVLITTTMSWVRRRRTSTRSWASLDEPHLIAALFKRAVEKKAECVLEIFDDRNSAVYRGHVLAADNPRLTLELSRPPAREEVFEGFPAQVHLNFRPGPKEPMEHYQFSSYTLDLDLKMEQDWCVARAAVAWPQSVISAQRRDFLRLEPVAEHAMSCALKENPAEPLRDLEALPALAEGSVLDIGVGGVQLIFPGIQELTEGRDYLLTLELPLTGLGLELQEPRLQLILTPLFRDVIRFGRGEAAGSGDNHTIVRGNFSGRYSLSREAEVWRRVGFSLEAFQDLARWGHAYLLYRLRKKNKR